MVSTEVFLAAHSFGFVEIYIEDDGRVGAKCEQVMLSAVLVWQQQFNYRWQQLPYHQFHQMLKF